ncbi:hypothetical protein ACFLYB_06965 [Chloroflexota bacterium]
MFYNWNKEYSALKEYIADNPQIKISRNVTTIPGDVRSEFFRLFDMVRVAFLKEKCQTLIDEAIPLSNNYAQAAQGVIKSLGLYEIKILNKLNWFLNDPVNGLIRSIYFSLFDLLKGEIDMNTFESKASESINISFRQLLESAYEKWVILSLVNLLAPDRALVVPIEDIQSKTRELEDDEKTGFFRELIPELKEMGLLSLEPSDDPAFIISNLIVRSTKLNRYVSMGTELTDATWMAKNVSVNREWLQIRNLGIFLSPIDNWPDLVIYVDDQPENIALVVDFGRFCRPDIIVECMEQIDWYQKGGLEKVRQNYDFFKPRLGSYVVSRFPVPEEVLKNFMSDPAASKLAIEQKTIPEEEPKKKLLDIHILPVGYDKSQLIPIIDILSSSKEIRNLNKIVGK